MKKILAGSIVVLFAGLFCTCLIGVFSETAANQHYAGVFKEYPYDMTY